MPKTSSERRLREWTSLLPKIYCASAILFAFSISSAGAQNIPGKLPKMTDLTFGQTGISISGTQNFVAQAKNFFKDENLNVHYIVSGQSAQVCQLLLTHDVDLGDCSLNDIIQIDQKSGAQLVLVANEWATALNYGLMTQPKIKTWSDLKGKTIMVGGPADNTVYFTRVMARAHGLKDKDYDFLYAGASSARFAALKAGAVDASMLTDPFDSEAELAGYNRLAQSVPKYVNGSNYAGGGLVTTKPWAQAHPKILVAYIMAVKRAIAWMYDQKNKEELFTILHKRLNLTHKAFDRVYQNNVVKNKMWSSNGGLATDAAVQGVVKSLVELGEVSSPAPPASKFYTNAYADMANKLAR